MWKALLLFFPIKNVFSFQYLCISTDAAECLNEGRLSRVTALFFLPQNFYKSEINKEEMYIRYIHKLCDMHLQAENYTGEGDIPQSLLEVLMTFFNFPNVIISGSFFWKEFARITYSSWEGKKLRPSSFP